MKVINEWPGGGVGGSVEVEGHACKMCDSESSGEGDLKTRAPSAGSEVREAKAGTGTDCQQL